MFVHFTKTMNHLMKMEQNISTVRSYGLMLTIFETQLRMAELRQMTWHVSTGGAILTSVGQRKR